MAEHPSLDDLADAAEDLLGPARAAEVATHVADCPSCQQSSAALRSVTGILAAAPAPPMPAAVAGRLEAALAQESARRQAEAARTPPPARRPAPARVTLGHFGGDRRRVARGRHWVPALAAACAATLVGFGGYVLSATAGLNEPPVVAAAVSTKDLAAQARSIEQSRDLDPHRFSNAWFCARSVTHGRITGLAGARVDGSPALLVYTRSDGADVVTVVTGCGALPPSAIASAPLPR
ncbi:hypothetical protein [uncultured Friedmanniella sp.]|uniref:hypothetical protein n=1 Tax=uncultured Friedmanniella sp. TaxID=335381 RepID=UPI0035CA4BC6